MAHIQASGLFLADWYTARHKELETLGVDPLEYFCRRGWRQGDRPNPYFDPAYYLATNQDVLRAGLNPLLHFITYGDQEGRNPSQQFDVKWYRNQFQLSRDENSLRHFLDRRFSGEVAPVPVFDPQYYFETNPDVAASGSDPFEHFLAFGVPELRAPAAGFDMKFYLSRYGDVLGGQNPLLHYLANRDSGKFVPARPEHEKLIPGAVKTATRPSAYFEEFRPVPATAPRRAKLLAFYLPQFHATAENDAWWGKGFTDWTNLSRGLPRFAGHLQPRVPRDLGFYALDDAKILRRQIAMAQGGGLSGFVFYFYWFNGKRLLDAPLSALLADAALNFPFCVMWANENWTRRWDGLEREVLMMQEYFTRDDLALIDCLANMFADTRYIRIEGRPLLMLYRAGLVPDAAARIAAWREMFRERHNENPLIVMAQSIGDYDPTPYGLDGAVEFPPHKISDEVATVNHRLDLLDPEFTAATYDYQAIAEASVAAARPDYPLIKTILPGWDNDPRREGKGLVLHEATPAKYQAWLEQLVADTGRNRFYGEPLICVNAWNEWAEGAFLEPDIHFGAAFLNATGRAICGAAVPGKAALLLVGHDAQPHGAQLLLLDLARRYRQVWGIEVHVLLLGAGPLVTAYQQVAEVSLTNEKSVTAALLRRYAALGIRGALVNTSSAARLVPALAALGIAATLLIHEMPNMLREHNLQVQARLGVAPAKHVVFASDFGRRRFCEAVSVKLDHALIMPQGNYQNIGVDAAARARTRQRLGVDDSAFLVLGAGFADLRKGFDLFLQIARRVQRQRDDVHFIWVGEIQPLLKTYLSAEMGCERFHHIGFTNAVAEYFAAADVYALTSREDPFPAVAVEALGAGMPVVAFEESGGIPALIRAHKAGRVAKFGDADDFRLKLASLLDHDKLTADQARLAALGAAQFSQTDYARNLLLAALPGLKTVSVCVLNYNYARFLRPRLNAIFAQTYPVCEILFFDDASTDDSVALAEDLAKQHRREMKITANATNSGAVFAQWRRAVEAASGEYVWLAEADDACAPDFLRRLMEGMAAVENPVLAVADARVIDAAGRLVAPAYQSAYRDAGAVGLSISGVWPAREFAQKFLSVRNLIFNVSGVVWRRDALLAALRRVAMKCRRGGWPGTGGSIWKCWRSPKARWSTLRSR